MNREQLLTVADAALSRAAGLARTAEDAARHPNHPDPVTAMAAVGALWADIARTHAAIAQATADDETTED